MQSRQTVHAVLLPLLSVLLLGVILAITELGEYTLTRPVAIAEHGAAIRGWEYVDGFPEKIAVFQTVFWEPRDTNSLRELIETTDLVHGKIVLEIGTGSGLVSLCCLRHGARRVVATDVNPNAVENARYNANMLDVASRLDVRLVSTNTPNAFEVLDSDEKFDVIVSNPPWENAQPRTIAEYALYDRDFELLRSILSGARSRLNPGGRLLLAYGCRDAIETLERLATVDELRVERHDRRSLHDLPEVFIPGMLLEIVPQVGRFYKLCSPYTDDP